MTTATKTPKRKRKTGLAGCVWCGSLTRGGVGGHAACPRHMREVADVMDAPGRALMHAKGGTVLTTVDFNRRAVRQRMGSIHVEAVEGPLGGRVVVRVVAGDGPDSLVLDLNVLRPSGARALAEALLTASETARLMEPWDGIPAASRVPARTAPAALTAGEPAQVPTAAPAADAAPGCASEDPPSCEPRKSEG